MISPDFIPIWSGIGTYVVSLLENLPKNIRVHLVTVKKGIPGSASHEEFVYNSDLFKRIKANVDIHFISDANDTFFYHLKFQSACLSYIPTLCKDHKIDLIHTHFPLMSDIQVKLLRGLDIPTVATVHSTIEGQHFGVKSANMRVSNMETSDIANLLLYYPLKFCELIYSRKISQFIAVSENIRQELIRYLNVPEKKIKTIYHGIDTNRFHPKAKLAKCPISLPSGRPILLFTGRFVATKGINTILKAVPTVIKQFPNALFVFVGGGNYEPYQSYLVMMGVPQRNFLFYGYVADYYDLPAVYSRSTITLAPTIYEPLGIRILEAMSCGKPVIASRIGGITEIIEHGKNGLLISPGDYVSLANAIVSLLSDGDLLTSMGKKARQRVIENFSVDRMARETFEFYRLFR